MPESLKTVKSGRFGNQSAIFHFHLGIFRTEQIYSEERNGAHAHYREPVPLNTVNGSASWFSDMPCDNYNL